MVRATTFARGLAFDEELAQRIAPPLVALCAAARGPLPKVMISERGTRPAGVTRRRGRDLLIVSRRFVDRIDDRQLHAILAHEVVHIARDDIRWVKLRAIVAYVSGLAAMIALIATSDNGYAIPVLGAALAVVTFAMMVVLAPSQRPIEWRADHDGALLANDPAGMALALRSAHDFSEEGRAKFSGSPLWRWLLWPLSWRIPTHPPIDKRLASLDQMALAAAGGGA